MVQFSKLFGNRTLVKLLEFFLQHSTASLSQTEVIQQSRVGKVTAIAALRKLGNAGILDVRDVGRTKLYSLKRNGLLVRQLKRFFNLTSPLIEDLLSKVMGSAYKVVVFGSYAVGEDREDSDVDVVIVGDIQKKELQAISELILKKYGKRLSLIIKTNEEFIKMPKIEPVLWNRLLEGGEVLYEA